MSEEKKTTGAEAPPLKDLTKKHFQDQIDGAKASIGQWQREITRLQDLIQQHVGIINYADHILKTFKLADAPKEELKKKPELEVK